MSDKRFILAAQGWVELGNYVEADEELDQVSPEHRTHPDALEVRWTIYENQKNWQACVDIANVIISLDAARASAWIHRSFALHELKRTEQALDLLLPAAEQFPDIWTIPYNMACYSAQLGRLNECEEWFKRAVKLNKKKAQSAGLNDPDLKPFWDAMSNKLKKCSH